ncbi:MAG: 50S ribosomal protein L3 [Candidatus Aenigmatarchaeota archaeon]|nr:MAG: 50S ribosomal protein L3 [Candidatus Aenigmarchaeota archaeon]
MSKSVTVIEVPPLFVAGARFYREIEERMEAIGEVYSDNIPKNFKEVLNTSKRKIDEFEGADDVRLIVATQPFSAGLSKKKPDVFEVGLGGTFEEKMNYVKEKLGKNLDISEVFEEGEYVDVIAVTKGKGFQGVVKRYGVKIRGRKDEQHHRQIGIMGPRGVARVLYTVPQPGQMGYHRRTEYNKYIVKIGDNPDEVNPKGGFIRYGLVRSKYVLLRGSVPGPKKRLVMMRKSIRGKGKRRVEIQEIETYSQQGVRYG